MDCIEGEGTKSSSTVSSGFGGEVYAAGARNAGSRGHALSLWLNDGFPNRLRSIPFLMHASPPPT
jgi:hypothetical protein